jgi:hypothetical protein
MPLLFYYNCPKGSFYLQQAKEVIKGYIEDYKSGFAKSDIYDPLRVIIIQRGLVLDLPKLISELNDSGRFIITPDNNNPDKSFHFEYTDVGMKCKCEYKTEPYHCLEFTLIEINEDEYSCFLSLSEDLD